MYQDIPISKWTNSLMGNFLLMGNFFHGQVLANGHVLAHGSGPRPRPGAMRKKELAHE